MVPVASGCPVSLLVQIVWHMLKRRQAAAIAEALAQLGSPLPGLPKHNASKAVS